MFYYMEIIFSTLVLGLIVLHRYLTVNFSEELAAENDPRYHLKSVNAETRDVLNQLDKDYKAPVRHKNTHMFNEDSHWLTFIFGPRIWKKYSNIHIG